MAGLLYDLSAKTVVVTYNNLITQITPIIITAPEKDEWFTLDKPDGASVDVACDGSRLGHVIPAQATGQLMFSALSPALVNSFINTMQQQQILGALIVGTLTITSGTTGWVNSYNNFVITSAYSGYEFDTRLKGVPVKFASDLPTTSNASTYIATGEAILTTL